MRISVRRVLAGAAGLAVLAAGGVAYADHGKVGLWSVTVTMGGAAPAMPDMSRMPPEVVARMRAMGMSMGGNSITVRHCMTAQEVTADIPHLDNHSTHGCTMTNLQRSGHSMTADLVCDRDFKGTGHVEFTYDSDTHYFGHVTMTGEADGHPVNSDEKLEGHWLSPNCEAAAN